MSKIENPEQVTFAMNAIVNYMPENKSPIYDEVLPKIAYEIACEISQSIIDSGVADVDELYEIIKDIIPASEMVNGRLITKFNEALVLWVSKSCEPAIYIMNNKPILLAQIELDVDEYIKIDNDVIITNSTFHNVPLYRYYTEFVSSDVTTESIRELFKTICVTIEKYVPCIENVEQYLVTQETTSTSEVYNPYKIELDLTKYYIETKTALKTGEWDE